MVNGYLSQLKHHFQEEETRQFRRRGSLSRQRECRAPRWQRQAEWRDRGRRCWRVKWSFGCPFGRGIAATNVHRHEVGGLAWPVWRAWACWRWTRWPDSSVCRRRSRAFNATKFQILSRNLKTGHSIVLVGKRAEVYIHPGTWNYGSWASSSGYPFHQQGLRFQ